MSLFARCGKCPGSSGLAALLLACLLPSAAFAWSDAGTVPDAGTADAGTVGDGSSQLRWITAPFTMDAGSCAGALTVQLQDLSGAPVVVGDGGLPFQAYTDSDGGSFFDNASCSGSASSGSNFTIPRGSSSTDLYYQDIRAGTPTVTAIASGLTGDSQTETVDPGPLDGFLVDASPNPVSLGGETSLVVTAVDAFDNVLFDYGGTVSFSLSGGSSAVVPAPYSFQPSIDLGQRYFSMTFPDPGTFTLTVTDEAVSKSGKVDVDVLGGPPVIAWDANTTAGVGEPYQFNADGRIHAIGGTLTYASCTTTRPDFRVDTLTGAVQWTPTADEVGGQPMCVEATNSAGTTTMNFQVLVSPPSGNGPTAQLSATPGSGPAPLSVQFDSVGSDAGTPIAVYRWDFGDGSPLAADAAPSHIYRAPGGYLASLTVFDDYGRSSTATMPILVTDAAGKRPPSAKIDADVLSGPAPLTVNLSCECTAGDAPLKLKRWEAGGQVHEGVSTSFTFDAGVYNVHLLVTDQAGFTATDEVQIVAAADQMIPPTCRLFGAAPSGPAPLNVTLTADVQPGSGDITQRSITLFDNSEFDGASTSATADPAGHYSATLHVTDSNNQTCTDTLEVTALDQNYAVPPRIVSSAPSGAAACAGYRYTPIAEGTQPFRWDVSPASSPVPSQLEVDPDSGVLSLGATPAGTAVSVYLNVHNAAGDYSQQIELSTGACQLAADVGCAAPGTTEGLWVALALLGLLLRKRHPARA